MRENLGEWGKIEEMLLSCPPGVESLATPLYITNDGSVNGISWRLSTLIPKIIDW